MSKSNRVFLCTCKIAHKKNNRKGKEHRHLNFHETEVDDEEICVHCGYYAWEAPMHVRYPRSQLVPWRSEVCGVNHWTGETELRDAYYGKTMFSDYEIDNGRAFEEREATKDLRKKSLDDELRDCYVRWGGESYGE